MIERKRFIVNMTYERVITLLLFIYLVFFWGGQTVWKLFRKVEDTYLQKRFAGLFSQSERTLAQSEIITAPN